MAYPNTIDSPQGTTAQGTSLLSAPDHAQDHRVLGSALVAVETVMGTTGGTSLFRNAVINDFAVTANVGGTLQQAITAGIFNHGTFGTPLITAGTITGQIVNSGTISGGVYGTALFQGGTVNLATLGTPTLILGSDAPQDIFYRSVAGTTTRLGAGTTGQVLQTQGTVSAPQWVNPSAMYFAMPANNFGFDRNAALLYAPLDANTASTSEAVQQMNIAVGTFTEIRFRVTNNTMSTATTIALRRNGTTTTLVGTVPATSTGNFVGTASIPVAAGDLVNYVIDSTTSTAANHMDIQSLLAKFVTTA